MLLEVKVLYGNQLKMKITLYDPSNTHEIVFLAFQLQEFWNKDVFFQIRNKHRLFEQCFYFKCCRFRLF